MVCKRNTKKILVHQQWIFRPRSSLSCNKQTVWPKRRRLMSRRLPRIRSRCIASSMLATMSWISLRTRSITTTAVAKPEVLQSITTILDWIIKTIKKSNLLDKAVRLEWAARSQTGNLAVACLPGGVRAPPSKPAAVDQA